MTRGTESGDQRNVASAVNPGGSWKPGDDAARTQGHIAFGPCEDPIKQEARDANFADIVTLPILPEPQQNPITAGMQMWRSGEFSAYGLKDRILGFWRWANQTNYNGEKWFHETRRRVPGVWECPTNDRACIYEAEMQFKKDREVDRMVLQVLEDRLRSCWNAQGSLWGDRDMNTEKCNELAMFKRQADMNYAAKYRNLNHWGVQSTKALMKQKNRFIEKRWLERQGKSFDEIQNMMHEPLSQAFFYDMWKWV